MTDRDLYLTRAAQARVDANDATLANVRDRCLRAANAWDEMADRAIKVEEMRTRLLADKAAAKQAEILSN